MHSTLSDKVFVGAAMSATPYYVIFLEISITDNSDNVTLQKEIGEKVAATLTTYFPILRINLTLLVGFLVGCDPCQRSRRVRVLQE